MFRAGGRSGGRLGVQRLYNDQGTWMVSSALVKLRFTHKTSQEGQCKKTSPSTSSPAEPQNRLKSKKTIAELDEEMRQKMAGIAGDGGDSGLELEDGKPVSMKRGVRENMFRYI